MILLKRLCSVLLILLVSACTKHPSDLVGVWKYGEDGMFSTQFVLVLNKDGTGSIHSGNIAFGGDKESFAWEASGKKFSTQSKTDSKPEILSIVSLSETDLVLQAPVNSSKLSGQLLSFKRIGDAPDEVAPPTKKTSPPDTPKAPDPSVAIENKLKLALKALQAAGDQYFLENGVSRVSYEELLAAYKSEIEAIKPIPGVDFQNCVISQGDGVYFQRDGRRYNFNYENSNGITPVATGPNGKDFTDADIAPAVRRGFASQAEAKFLAIDTIKGQIYSWSGVYRSVRGEASLKLLEDLVKPVERIGIEGDNKEKIAVTVVKQVKNKGDLVTVPFEADVSVNEAAPSIALDMSAITRLGQPISSITPFLVKGTPEHQQAENLLAAYMAAHEKAKMMKEPWNDLQFIKKISLDYDAFVHEYRRSSNNIYHALKRGLGDSAIANQFGKAIQPSRRFTNERARHAAFVDLISEPLVNEYKRVADILKADLEAGNAFRKFLNQLNSSATAKPEASKSPDL